MLKKKDLCDFCGFYAGDNICGAGLGRTPTPLERTCIFHEPIRAKRCGTCKHFVKAQIDKGAPHGHCNYHDDFRNFFNSCQTPGAYEMENGKDLRYD